MENEVINKILKLDDINYNIITKSKSGFTNNVFFIDDNYVIKFTNDISIKEKLERETNIYKNLKLPFIPTYIKSGDLNDYKYLIIEKVKGKTLYSIWHTLSKEERINIIIEIANIVKEFHKVSTSFFNKYYTYEFKDYIKTELLKIKEKLDNLNLNTFNLDNIINKHFDILFSDCKIGLVYNDLHFDNFLYNDGKIYLIDFDRTTTAFLDYEMMIFKTMCDNPSKFANEEDENNIVDSDYANIYQVFKDNYKELFQNKYTEIRIFIYQFIYLINQAIECNNNEWINEELQKLNCYYENSMNIFNDNEI